MDGTTITVAEAVGLREGLKFARRKGIQKLIVEGDSNIVVNAAFGQWEVPWHIHSIVQDIRMLAKEFLFVERRHIFKEANFVTDDLTHFDLSISNPQFWDRCIPSSALHAFYFDCARTGCTRGFVI